LGKIKIEKMKYWLVGFIALIYILFNLGLNYPPIYSWFYLNTSGLKPNEYGDSFGSFNALIGCLTLAGLVWNYLLLKEQVEFEKDKYNQEKIDQHFQSESKYLLEKIELNLNLFFDKPNRLRVDDIHSYDYFERLSLVYYLFSSLKLLQIEYYKSKMAQNSEFYLSYLKNKYTKSIIRTYNLQPYYSLGNISQNSSGYGFKMLELLKVNSIENNKSIITTPGKEYFEEILNSILFVYEIAPETKDRIIYEITLIDEFKEFVYERNPEFKQLVEDNN